MSTFVLIHGAWHGGWCWRKVEPLLRQSGARVYAPSLSGMGERSHLTKHIDPSAINLDLHIEDVTKLLESEGLDDAILVGHAYAGMVITGVAEVCPQRVAHLVYINGVVPKDGEAMVDQLDAVAASSSPPGFEGPLREGRISCRRPALPRKSSSAGLLPSRRTSPGCCPGYPLSQRPPSAKH